MTEVISFGKYAIMEETVHKFVDEPSWWWKIKPIDAGMELAIQKFLFSNRREVSRDGITRDNSAVSIEAMLREIALTFGGTNIPLNEAKKVEDGGDPYIKVGSSTEEIEIKLRAMPTKMLTEIWEAVGEAAPGWGPLKAQTT